MASFNSTIIEHRLCKVDKEVGYFHCWEQYSDVVEPGLTIGSHPGGQYSQVFGIIEFDDRVEQVDPSKIKFIDEIHYSLQKYFEVLTEKEESNNQ